MSYTFTLSGKESILTAIIFPPIILNENEEYAMGLINFESYNSIPNVDSTNNIFHYDKDKKIVLPEGSYEINDIHRYLANTLSLKKELDPVVLRLEANRNTLKCEIKCNRTIDFSKPNSIGSLLGFGKKKLEPNTLHISENPVDIFKVNSIAIECNLVNNSYNNGKQVHVVHMFYPTVSAGFKIAERPTNVIYLPINTCKIDEIQLKITDQDGKLVNFRKELVTIRLHLKKIF